MADRQMGVLLHVSCLPGRHGIGDVGPSARHFVDWLASAGVGVWQVLPLSPPGGWFDDVPYASWSAMAGSPQLISLDDLEAEGLLPAGEDRSFEEGWCRHEDCLPFKQARLSSAVARVHEGRWLEERNRFVEGSPWAVDTARFAARAEAEQERRWWMWSSERRSRDPSLLARVDDELRPSIDRALTEQFLFERQWQRLRAYAHERGVRILGDVSFNVLAESADVWAFPRGWKIQPDGSKVVTSGAPPDVFSAEGQNWGCPVYDWAAMAEDGYRWWVERLRRTLSLVDAVRLDHFRGFAAAWEIPDGSPTARDGRWVTGPGAALFERIERELGSVSLWAEDLGTIDEGVHQLLAGTGIPSMRVFHYAFGGDAANPPLPHNVPANALVYPGNHDNDTTVGWWASLPSHVRTHAQHYFGRHGDDIVWDLIRVALASPARLAVVSMQDLLQLDSRARMNDPASYGPPGRGYGNWRWRLGPGWATPAVAERLRFLGGLYGRI
jgi:4-alpha-glucanotransferase